MILKSMANIRSQSGKGLSKKYQFPQKYSNPLYQKATVKFVESIVKEQLSKSTCNELCNIYQKQYLS